MSSPATAQPLRAPRAAWIVNAWWDLGLVVVTPLLIVPVVLILARNWLTPEQVSIAVIAFASLGHHLPGFMRAYGDRELFSRFRARFLLVPPLMFAMALMFSPPSSLQSAFGLNWTHLHGLELILLFWGTWHGLMQTYGFMRIYDVRMGVNDRWSARLDHWLCLIVFIAGVVFSDARVFAFASTAWETGLPVFSSGWLVQDGLLDEKTARWIPVLSSEWLLRLRWLVGLVGIGVLLAYFINLWLRYRRGEATNWLKLLLIGITGWFYWYTGKLSTNVLIGLAMFEIYHAIQYYSIVWTYNRRLFKRVGERFGLLGFLFRDKWSMLGFYLAAIAAYSCIRYFTVDTGEYIFRGSDQSAHQWLIAFFVTSSMLHFYFDGFIWQVSEKKTQENLVDNCSAYSKLQHRVPGFIHATKLFLLFGLSGGLLYLESCRNFDNTMDDRVRVRGLAALTPELPECQSMLCRDALQRRDARAAVEHGERALNLRPRSHAVRADLGLALLLAGRWEEAKQRFEEAIEIEPENSSYHTDLAFALQNLEEFERAEAEYRQAIALAPNSVSAYQQLANFLRRQNRLEEETAVWEEIAERFPDSLASDVVEMANLANAGEFEEAIELGYILSVGPQSKNNWRVWLMLGKVHNMSGHGSSAIQPLRNAARLGAPRSETDFHLGWAHLGMGQPARAVNYLMRVTKHNPENFEARLRLASALFLLKKYDQAIENYELCLEQQPTNEFLCQSLGGIYTTLGKFEEAEELYRVGLEAHPDSAQLHYNFGVLQAQLGNQESARNSFSRAEELGLAEATKMVELLDSQM